MNDTEYILIADLDMNELHLSAWMNFENTIGMGNTIGVPHVLGASLDGASERSWGPPLGGLQTTLRVSEQGPPCV